MLDRTLPAALLALLLLAATAPSARAQPDGLPLPAKPSKAALPAKIETGFDPKVDGLPFVNVGNYGSTGDCMGMSILAIDRYLRRKAGETPAAPVKPAKPLEKGSGLVGDPVDHEVTAIVQALASDDEKALPPPGKFSDAKRIKAALVRMKATGEPETLGLDDGHGGPGHCVVVFGYRDGELLIYDPNYPGETVEWPFDPAKGMKKYPKALGKDPKEARMRRFYSGLDHLTFVPFHRYKVSRELAKIRGECSAQAKACTKDFATVTTTVKPSKDGKTARVTGKVSRGRRMTEEGPTDPPARVWLRVNGALEKTPLPVAKDGSFSVVVPAASLHEGENTLQVIAATRMGSFAGTSTAKPFTLGERTGIAAALGAPGR